MSKLVSIIIPCYKQAQFLDECLNSVYLQTYHDWECIIVNDGSPDNTNEVANNWLTRDDRFKYVEKQNGGLSSARNTGLKLAKGEYVQFLDCDDTLHPLKLEKQLDSFTPQIDISLSDYFPFENQYKTFFSQRYLTPFLNDYDYKYNIVLLWENKLSIPCHCIIFRRHLLTLGGDLYFDDTLPNHEDWVFWTKLFYRSEGLVKIRIALANYRIHFKSMCYDESNMRIGFLLAADRILDFFETMKDSKGMDVAKLKRESIDPKVHYIVKKRTTSRIKRIINLLTPPILMNFILKYIYIKTKNE